MTGYTLRLKSKNGQHVVNNLEDSSTVLDLKMKISQLTQIELDLINILIGFPPKALNLSDNNELLKKSGIKSGDTLIIEELKKSSITTGDQQAPIDSISDDEKLARRLQECEEAALQSAQNSELFGVLLKKVVPADNSCLFTSIGFVLNGKIDTDCGSFMRSIIANEVSNDKDTYTEGFLGKSNLDYCNWIQKPESWGGAIEVSILSHFYGVEIDVVDITNAIINRFGEDKNFGLRVFLLFDGIHYDPLYMDTGDLPKTIFPIEEIDVYQQAEQLALEAKSSRQFTDVNKFTLRCIECDTMLVGQNQAQQHAIETGHTNFGEV